MVKVSLSFDPMIVRGVVSAALTVWNRLAGVTAPT